MGGVKIVGHGLEPLCGSTVLERLFFHGNAKFAEPIVYSIINAIYSSDKVLDRLELLHDLQSYIEKARNDTSSPFHEICTNIQQTLLDNGQCQVCWKSLRDRTCVYCLKQVCTDCGNDFSFASCDNCGDTFCESCDDSVVCNGCHSEFCSGCAQLDNIDAAISCSRCDVYCFICSEGCGECLPVRYQKMIARIDGLTEDNEQLRQQIDQLQLNE